MKKIEFTLKYLEKQYNIFINSINSEILSDYQIGTQNGYKQAIEDLKNLLENYV